MLRAVLLSLALLLAGCSPSQEAVHFNATDITGADWGRDFHLTDSSGKPRSLTDFKGKVVMLFFGYTQCPDVCPTTMTRFGQVVKLLGQDAVRVKVLFVTLDPERDTPELLTQYTTAFNPDFLALTGSPETIAATAKDFKVFYQKQPGSAPGRYTIDHTAANYVFDAAGRLRLFIRDGETPAQIVDDLKVLLAGR